MTLKEIQKFFRETKKSLGGEMRNELKELDKSKLFVRVLKMLSMGPKHLIIDKFNKMHFLA